MSLTENKIEEVKFSEGLLIFLIASAQCINVLDFQMVMPLGPDFTKALQIEASSTGYIGGSYTLAAAISGLLSSRFLDKFDRKIVLCIALLGLSLGTAAGGFATGFYSLIASRVFAGSFGGPAAAIALAIVADVIPKERIGKAMGAVLAAFSVAAVLGVPMGLQLSLWFGWRSPFWVVAALGLLVAVGAFVGLPSLKKHLTMESNNTQNQNMYDLSFVVSCVLTFSAYTAGFILVPNVSQFVQYNLAYPRESMGFLYFVGGLVSFVTMLFVGKNIDKRGSFLMGTIGVVLHVTIVFLGFGSSTTLIPVEVIYIVFMMALAFRNVSMNTLFSKVPTPKQRAKFMSIQTAVQHFASAGGAFLSSKILVELPGGKLEFMPAIAYISIAFALLLPACFYVIEREVRIKATKVFEFI